MLRLMRIHGFTRVSMAPVQLITFMAVGITGIFCLMRVDNISKLTSFVEFCLGKLRLLLNFNVKPIMVFDGAPLPMKKHQENSRGR